MILKLAQGVGRKWGLCKYFAFKFQKFAIQNTFNFRRPNLNMLTKHTYTTGYPNMQNTWLYSCLRSHFDKEVMFGFKQLIV